MMSKPSSWNASFKGVDRIIQYDNIDCLGYNQARGKVRKLAADHFGCNCKDPKLKVKFYQPEPEQNRISAAVKRSFGPQKRLTDFFGVV